MTLVRQEGSDRPIEGPLCPYWGVGDNDRHRFFNQLKDRLYHYLPKDDDDNLDENHDGVKLYYKLDEFYPYHMYLYRAEEQAVNRYTQYVETYYYQCSICYFVLPATGVKTR